MRYFLYLSLFAIGVQGMTILLMLFASDLGTFPFFWRGQAIVATFLVLGCASASWATR